MRETILLATAVGAIVLVALVPESGGAQPFTREQLLQRGNDSFPRQCLESAMNYYAILQQFPGWLNADGSVRARRRIEQCRNSMVGGAGIDGKGDIDARPIPAPPPPPPGAGTRPTSQIVGTILPTAVADSTATPRTRACRAYADTAVAQFQAQTARRCGQQGVRWHANHQDHYNWCMQAQTSRQVEAEAGERSRTLHACLFRW